MTDAETTVFVYSAGKLIAEYSTRLSQSPSIAYTTTDHLGTPRVITDQFGRVKARRDFMPFGEEITPDGTHRTTSLKYNFGDNIRQKFTGYQKDEETQLDFAEARMYQNLHARFTAVDPLLASGKSANPQTFNRYVYVMNNPLIFTDPTGLQAGNYTGSVYYKVLEDGRWAFSHKSGKGYDTRYTGGARRITAIDGYEYTITSKGWRQHGLDVVAARGRTESTPQSPKSQDAINTALLKDLGMRATATQKFLLILMLSGVAGGASAAGAVGTPTFFLVVGGEALLAEQGVRHLGQAEREQALMLMGSTQLEASGTIDPSKVAFSQDSVSPNFKDPQYGSIDDLAEGLRNRTIDPNSVEPIRLVEIDGKIQSLDNRRLEAFRQAGVEIPYRLATPAEYSEAVRRGRFSTRNGGTSVRIRR